MYQQITKRYVLLRCDYPASGFYQMDQIQAYPSRSLDLPSRCLFSIETRGQLRGAAWGASSTRVAPPKASCLPNDVVPGPSDSVDCAVLKPACSLLLQGDIRAEGCAFIGLRLRGKRACKGLVTCNCKARIAPHVVLGHLIDTSSLSPRRAVQRPNGNTRDAPCLALVWPCLRVFQGEIEGDPT